MFNFRTMVIAALAVAALNWATTELDPAAGGSVTSKLIDRHVSIQGI